MHTLREPSGAIFQIQIRSAGERLGYFCRKYVESLNLRKLLVSAAVTKHVVCFGIWSSCHAEILFLFHGEIRISVGFVFFEVP